MQPNEFIEKTRKEWDMTLEGFGAYLAENVPGLPTSRQAVYNWENGTAKINVYDVAKGCVSYPEADRRRAFFRELLGLMLPAVKEMTQ